MKNKPLFRWFRRFEGSNRPLFEGRFFGRMVTVGRDDHPNAGCRGWTQFFLCWNGGSGYGSGLRLEFNTPTRALFARNLRTLQIFGPSRDAAWRAHGVGIIEINQLKIGGRPRFVPAKAFELRQPEDYGDQWMGA